MSDEIKRIPMGGQAVIEGVMMRGPQQISIALRRSNGEIEIKTDKFISLIKKKKWLNFPVIRGAIGLIEMMVIGIKALNYSADTAMQDFKTETSENTGNPCADRKPKKPKKKSNFAIFITLILALGLGIGLFFVAPLYITTHLFDIEKSALPFNSISGSIRLIFFLVYILLISQINDIKRVFEYHGAEHKAIFAYENKAELIPDVVSKYPRLHPRCGTSFLLMVMLISVVSFIIIDTILIGTFGNINLGIRLLTHLPFIPLIGGISYEFIKLSDKKKESRIAKFFIQPGLWLQLLTTKEPDMNQLEVSIAALRAAIGESQTESKTLLGEVV